jgi:hypothetical protein
VQSSMSDLSITYSISAMFSLSISFIHKITPPPDLLGPLSFRNGV